VKNFEYIKPTSLADTIFAFEKNEDAFLLAGGTDLLVGMKHGLIKPGCIIDSNNWFNNTGVTMFISNV